MVDATRALLDELMGRERNTPLQERSNRKLKFSDPEICKYQLCGLCPYTLFTNTRSYLGACKYEMHDEIGMDEIQAQYDALSERDKHSYGYERDLLALLEQLSRDMDRKIERAKERASKESAPRELTDEDRVKLDEILNRQKGLVESSEKMAEEGDVDASMALAQQADALKVEHDKMLATMTAPERIMSVCEVCGVFINSTDNDQRRQDHLEGKQYVGWLAIRAKLKELREKFRNPPPRSYDRDRPSADVPVSGRGREHEREPRSRPGLGHSGRDDHRSSSGRDDHRSGSRRERERSPRGRDAYRGRDSSGSHRSAERRRERERDRAFEDSRR